MSQSVQVAEPLPWVGTMVRLGLALVLAVALLPTGLAAVADGSDGGWRWALWAALTLLHATLVLPLSTRWPLVAFGAGSACMLVLVVAPDLGGALATESGGGVSPVLLPSGLVWFVLLYGVSASLAAPWPSVALATGMVGSLLVVVRLWDFSDSGGAQMGPWTWRLLLPAGLVGGVLAAWALGRYRATRLAWSSALADRAAAEERRRIAREMHDVVAHSLAVVVAQAEGGRMLASTQPDRASEVLEAIATQGREALSQMRGLLGVLRADDAPESPVDAPQPTLADLPALVAQVRSTGREVTLETFGDPRPLGSASALTAFRVVQESLTNVVKHAGAHASARVTVDWTDGLTVTVLDDGPAVEGPLGTGGGGLRGMRERVEAVGGELDVGPGPQTGWRTCARIPA